MYGLLSLFQAEEVEQEQKELFEISVNGNSVQVRILFEERYNNRVSVGAKGILIRISRRMSKEEQRKQIDSFLRWAKEKLGDKPELLDCLPQRRYVNGEVLQVGTEHFTIHIYFNKERKSKARLHRNLITISLAEGLKEEAQLHTCSYLVSRCLSKYFQPRIEARVHELNGKFFGKTIRSVKLKYNTSNWGSCSYQGNINISLRLLFAPQDVIDYVIIHELAHLIHHDHSPRFWKLVESVMPDFREKEKHLRENHLRYYL